MPNQGTVRGLNRLSASVINAAESDRALKKERREAAIEDQQRSRDQEIQDEELRRKRAFEDIDLDIKKDEADILERTKPARQKAADDSLKRLEQEERIGELNLQQAESDALASKTAAEKMAQGLASEKTQKLLDLTAAISESTNLDSFKPVISQTMGFQVQSLNRTHDGGLEITDTEGRTSTIPSELITNAKFNKFVKNSGGLVQLSKDRVGFFDPRKFAKGESPVTIMDPDTTTKIEKQTQQLLGIVDDFMNKGKIGPGLIKDVKDSGSGAQWAATAASTVKDIVRLYPTISSRVGENILVSTAMGLAENRIPQSQLSNIEKGQVINDYRMQVTADIFSQALGTPVSVDEIQSILNPAGPEAPPQQDQQSLSLPEQLKVEQAKGDKPVLQVVAEELAQDLIAKPLVRTTAAAIKAPSAVANQASVVSDEAVQGFDEVFNIMADIGSVISEDVTFDSLSDDSSLKKLLSKRSDSKMLKSFIKFLTEKRDVKRPQN